MKISRILLSNFIRKRPLLKRIMPGIRIKFSILIGVFISLILAVTTYINYINQSSILEKTFNNDIEKSLNYINPIVNSIDGIRANLFLIEELKLRVIEKRKDLQKYKTYALTKKDSFANSLKSFGKSLGMEVSYDYYYKGYDSYYSTYLSQKDISALEKKTSSQLKKTDGSEISAGEFKDIQNKANIIVQINKIINSYRNQLDANNEKLNLINTKESREFTVLTNQNRAIQKKIDSEFKRLAAAEKKFRNKINYYYNYQLKRIEDSGINNNNIRIVTYNNSGDVNSDTGNYFRDSLLKFSPLVENKQFEKERIDFFKNLNIYSTIRTYEYDYISGSKYFHVKYVPVYKNRATSERLVAILKELETNSSRWNRYIEEDSRICSRINESVSALKTRLEILRNEKTVPGKDENFRTLYSEYMKLIRERDNSFEKYAPYKDEIQNISDYYNDRIQAVSGNIVKETRHLDELKTNKNTANSDNSESIESSENLISEYQDEISRLTRDMEDAKEDLWKSEKLLSRNAMKFVRESALFDYAILKQKTDPAAYRNYLRSAKNREIDSGRWSTMRDWIISGLSETALPENVSGMKNVRLVEDGILAYSRSEIEEYMWKIDSTPIAGNTGLLNTSIKGGLVEQLLNNNINGFHGVFIDKTDGILSIARNRDRMIIYSALMALVAIILTYFLAGFMVKRIKGIIDNVKLAGMGNLNINFTELGLDEIEDLAVSLNSMIRGLREKEELKGEIAAAGEIQKTLLPETIPSNLEGYYSIGTFYRPMQGVGGDYYDFIELDEESIFFCIADVSNHGVGPAIVMSMLRAHIHGILRRGIRELKEILLELNRQIYLETPPAIFVTIFTGIINKNTNEIIYCSAGHLKPVLYKYKKDEIEILPGGGLPVGMDDNDFFEDTISVNTVKLRPGDLFFQYTDGVSEAMDDSRNLFGENRLYEEIKNSARKKPGAMILDIAEKVEKFTGKTIIRSSMSELNDDIAMIALKRIK